MKFIRRYLARMVSFEVENLEEEVLVLKRNIDELSKHDKHLKSMVDNMLEQNYRLIQDKSILEEENERQRRHISWLEIDNNNVQKLTKKEEDK